MANMYTQFSTAFKVTTEQAQWLIDRYDLMKESAIVDDDIFPPGDDALCPPDFKMEIESWGGAPVCWIADEEGESGADGAVDFLIRYTRNNPSGGPIVLEYAFTCSKQRVGEFGGGVAVVHKGHYYINYTSKIGSEQLKLIEQDEAAWLENNSHGGDGPI